MALKFKFCALACALMAYAAASAAECWHAVLSSGEKIPTSQIECMLMAPGANTYDIVLNHDNIIYTDVTRVSFEFCEEDASLFGIHAGESISGPYHDAIVVSGCAPQAEINIFNSMGQRMYSATFSDSCTIDISSFPAGIYVLCTPNSRVKFIKR